MVYTTAHPATRLLKSVYWVTKWTTALRAPGSVRFSLDI